MKNKREVLVKLFLSTLYLSAFTFGGGYVIITLMKKKFVDDYHWIEENEMLDLVAIAQSAPGPIAAYCRQEKDTLWDESKRLFNPHQMYIDLSPRLYEVKKQLLDRMSADD